MANGETVACASSPTCAHRRTAMNVHRLVTRGDHVNAVRRGPKSRIISGLTGHSECGCRLQCVDRTTARHLRAGRYRRSIFPACLTRNARCRVGDLHWPQQAGVRPRRRRRDHDRANVTNSLCEASENSRHRQGEWRAALSRILDNHRSTAVGQGQTYQRDHRIRRPVAKLASNCHSHGVLERRTWTEAEHAAEFRLTVRRAGRMEIIDTFPSSVRCFGDGRNPATGGADRPRPSPTSPDRRPCFDRGFVTYSNEAKQTCGASGRATARRLGAVSGRRSPPKWCSAHGAARRRSLRFRSPVSRRPRRRVGEKPVGLVWMGLSGPDGF